MSDPVAQRSRELFESGLYCAESIVLAMAESQGIQSPLLPKIATGFCGGVADTGGMCGALAGAIMGIGLAAGRTSPDEPIDPAFRLSRELLNAFEREFGSINCRQLTGCDLTTEAGRRAFEEGGVFARCQRYVESAATIATRLIGDSDLT